MVTKYKHKKPDHAAYSPTKMPLAIRAVKNKDMGLKKAAKTFSANRSTLQKKMQGKLPKVTKGAGHPIALTAEVELELATCLKTLAEWGFGFYQS